MKIVKSPALFLFALLLLITSFKAFAQAPAWDSGQPTLRREVRSLGLGVNLDRQATVYYVIYRIGLGDPGVGGLTAAQIKANSGSATGRVANGSFVFGDNSYCRLPPGACNNTAENLITRFVSVDVPVGGAGGTNYRVYLVAENGSGFSPVIDRLSDVFTATTRCFGVGSTTSGPAVGNNLTPITDRCSPSQYLLEVFYTGVDYATGTTVEAVINFGTNGTTGTNYTLALQPSAHPVNTVELNKAFRRYKADIVQTYDYTLGHNPGSNSPGSGCTFHIDANLGTCTGFNTEIDLDVTVWDRPNTARGLQDVEPNGLNNNAGGNDEEYEICAGDRNPITFTDNSVFNCTTVEEVREAAVLPFARNREARWVQWVYGAAGTTVTTSGAANDQVTINGFNFTDAQFPIYGPVQYLPANVDDPNSTALPIRMPINAAVNSIFMVEMRSWNTCLPYDNTVADGGLNPTGGGFDLDGGLNNGNNWFTAAGAWPGNATTFPNANRAPITFPKPIIVTTAPAAPTFSPNPYIICEERTDDNDYLITLASPAGTPTFRVYSDAALTVLERTDNTAPYTYNPVTQGPNAINKNNPGTYTRYAVVQTGPCTSLPVTIPIVIEEKVDAGVIAHPGPLTICSGDDPAAFTSTTAATGGRDGTPVYLWQSAFTLAGAYTDIAGATSATYNPPAISTGDRTFFRRRARSDNGGVAGVCAEAFSNVIQFTINTPVQPGSINNTQTICTGQTPGPIGEATPGSGGTGTPSYSWQFSNDNFGADINTTGTNGSTFSPGPLTVTTYYRRVNTSGVCIPTSATSNVIVVTVQPVINPGVIAGNQTICAEGDPAAFTSTTAASGGNGALTYQWQSASNAAFTAGVTNVGTNSPTFDPPAGLTVTTFYRRVASGGPCTAQATAILQVTVNPLPTASVSGGGSICSGVPASNIVFTLGGAGPWNLVYSINAVSQPAVNGITTSPYEIPTPAQGIYRIVSIQDSNTPVCTVTAPHANITGTATVTTQTVDPPTVDAFTAQAPVCDNGAGTNPPDAILDLDPNSIQPYAITYRLRRVSTNTFLAGSINFTGSSDAAGIVNLAPTYAQLGAFPTDPQGYQVVITAIQNTATLCAGAVPINGPTLIVNPRPAAPTGAVPGIACSTAGSGAAISVTAPAVGFTIVWSTTAAPTFTAAAGNSATGTRGNIFIPTSNATVTYHAFTRDDVTPTNCLSAASLSVQHTQDVAPTTSVAGGAQANCNGNFTLAANLPNAGNFEVGTWTVPGIAYTQLFNYASGTTTSAAVNGWSRDISGAGVFAGGTGSFQVNGNQFEANNIDGAGGAGAEAVWLSPVVNVATMPNLSISINLSSTNTHEAGDYLRVFYKLNGGAEIALTNGTQNGNITGTVTATAAGLTGTTIQLVVRANNGQPDETYRFDNILIATATAPTISDQNSRTADVSNLPVGPNVLTWTITSRFGVCTPSATTVTLTRHPLPTVNTIARTLCEDTFGGASTANVSLSQYDIPVSDEPGAPVAVPNNTTVEYYSANTRLPANQITAPTTILNNQVVFTRVRNSSTTCTSDGTITFTVRTLPAKQDLIRQVCEDAPPGSLVATGINLQNFETAIANGSMVGRNIEWYEDVTLTVLIPAGNAAGAEENYSINADKTIHAKIIDTGSPTTPQCFRQATLALDYQPRPSNNQISDGIGQVLGATYTVCASSNLVLLQLNPGTNPGSTITWTVPPPSYAGEFELLTGTTGFFIILRFPNPIPGTGTLYPTGVPISVKETLGTVPCDGNTINTRIVVEGSPPKPIITGPPTVCTNANGVVFTVTNPVAGTYSWTLPAGATITSLPVTASSITVQMSTFSGNVSVTHSSGTGCTSPASDLYPVAVANRPSITSTNAATLCSGQNVTAVYTLTSNIVPTTYNWEVITVTGAVTGTNLGNTATGVTSINQTLVNTSGVTASVTYRVTPIGPGPDNCPGTPLNVTITVNPQPVLVAGQTKTICSGAAAAKEILLIPANLPAGTLFNWPDPDGGGPATAGVNIPMGTAGTVHINDVLTNLTNSPITINYVITPTSGANCPGVSQTVAIIVNPQPVGHNDTTPIACSGLPAGYDLELNIADTGAGGNNLITGTTYSWVATANGNVTGESTTPQSGKIVSDVLRNITNANQVVRYTITPTSAASCVGAAFTVDITVRPEPRGFNDASPLICSDGTVNYNLSNNIANTGAGGNNLVTGTTYSWVATANANVSGESTTPQTTATISDALNNITNSSQVVVYTVTPTSALGCAGNSFTVSVTVRPEPKGYNDATPIICSDASVNYNLEANILNTGLGGNGLISGTTYAWNAIANANVTGEGNGTGQTITNVLNNITNVNQVVVYEVIPTSGNGCAGDMFTVSVTVRPEPRGYNDNTPVICSDASVNYVLSTNIANTGLGGNNLVTGTTYTWIATSNTNVGGESTTSQSGGTITDVLNNVTNVNQVVTYTVTPTSTQGCVGDQFTVAVTVRPEPRGYNDNTPIRCSDVTINYNLTANVANVGLGGNNLVTGTTFSWVAASNATVAGESTTPQAGTSITDVVTNITNSNQVVVYTVTPTSANGCVGNDFTVSVTIRPEPRGYNDNSPVACSDVNINYVLSTNVANTGLGGNNLVTGTTYSWVAAANANVLGESTTPIAGGTINDVVNNVTTSDQVVVYTVTPTSADGCAGDPFIVSVTIRPEPRGYNDTTPFVCSDVAIGYDLVANVANTGLGGNNLITGTTYSWVATANANVTGESTTPQTGSTITDIVNNVTSANQVVTYTVTPTSAQGCAGNTFTVAVTVRPEPRGFNDNTPIVCSDAPAGVNYNLASNVANTGLGGNNLVTGTTFSWVAASNSNVGGENTTPQAGTIITDVLTNITNGNQIVVYTVTPTSVDGCVGNDFTISVNVRPEPKGFDDNTPVACSDVIINYDLVSNITNTVSGGNNLAVGTTYSWIAANNPNTTGESTSAKTGSILNDIVNNVTNANEIVVYTVTPTSINGCVGDPFIVSVTIRPEPRGFNDTTPIVCSDLAIGYDLVANVANTGLGGNNLVTGTTYSWVATSNANVTGESTTPQTGSTITDIVNNVTNAIQVVTYTVTPTSAQGCAGNTFTVAVTVRPEPRGHNDNTPIVCSDAPANYNLTSNVADTGAGGNNLVTGTTFSWVAASNSNVGGESTTPQAGATITDVLTNSTNGNQVVVYTVTPTSADGCVGNNFTVSINVRPEPKGFDDNTPVVCSDVIINYDLVSNITNTASGGNNLAVGTTYSWIAANNPNTTGESTSAKTGSIINDIVNNVTNANEIVVYTVTPTSINGCVGDPFLVSVTIRPEPRGFNDNTPLICSDATLNYDLELNVANTVSGGNNLVTGTTYSWIATSNTNVGGESTSAQAGSVITDILNNVTNANQVVVYSVTPTSALGCAGNVFTVSVTVRPEPRGYNDNTPVICSDATVAYDLAANVGNTGLGGNNLVTGTTYSWEAAANPNVTDESTTPQAGSTITDALNNVTNSNQTVVYTVTATSGNGCVGNPFTVTVTVRPEPKGFDDSSPIVCSDVNINYDLVANISNIPLGGNSLIVGTTYSWVAASNPNVTGESTSPQTGNTINNVINNVTNGNEIVVYTVTPTSINGCVGNPFLVSVTVRPEPRGHNDNTPLICSDDNVNYDLVANVANTGLGGNNLVTGTTYSWIATANANVTGESTLPQAGSTINDVLNNVTTANQVVVYSVTPTSGNACVGNVFTVSVTVRPEPRGYNDNTPVICSDDPAGVNYNLANNVANVGLGGNNLVTGTTYSWVAAANANVGGESTAPVAGGTITDVLNNVTNSNQIVVYTVTPTSALGCVGNNFTVSITVRPEPRGFNDNSPIVCSDLAVNYNLVANISNIGMGGNNLVTGTTFSWIATANANVTGESDLIAGTSSTITDVINNVTNADQVVVYTVTPTSSDGCVGNTFTVSVTVRPEPKGFNDNTPLACSDVAFNYDLVANIANTGLGGNNLVTGTTYSWIATPNPNVTGEGNGTTSTITDVINNVTNVNQVVVYTVTPTSGNSCVGNTFTVSVTIRPEPRGFNDNTPVICSDEPTGVNYNLNANIANTVSGGNNLVTGTTYSWIATSNTNVAGESTSAQAGATISDVLTNITNVNQVVVYTVTPTSGNGCAGNPFIVSVTVRPEPRGFNDTKIICSDANVNYDLPTNIANTGSGGNNLLIGTSYSWIAIDNPNVTGETTVTPGTTITINDVLNNVTAVDQPVVYNVVATSNNGCPGDMFTVTITVRPEPKGFNDNSPIICSDANVNYDLELNIANTASGGNNLVTGTTYSWIATANANVGGESTTAQAGSVINDVLNNVTNVNQVVVYTVTPTSALGCVGNNFTVSVTVRPEPRGFNDNSPSICSKANVNYDLSANIANTVSGGNNLVAGTTYSWVAADNSNVTGESLAPVTTATITDVLTNVTGSNQVVVYTITPTSGNSCVGNDFTVSVTVRPEPIGLADADDVCSDEGINYNIQTRNINLLGNSVSSQFTYTVVSSDPGNVSVAGKNRPVASNASITDTYTNITSNDVLITYTITPFSATGTCQGTNFDVVFTIHPEPLGPNTTIQRCSDDPVNFDLQDVIDTPTTGNSVPSKFRYSVSSNNPLAVAPGANRNTPTTALITDVYTNLTNADVEITYTVTPSSLADDCEGSVFTFKVIVHPEPVGANVTDPVCSTSLNYNIQTQNINTLGNAVPSVFTYTVVSTDPVGVPPAANRAVASNAPITDAYVNATGVDVTITYTITPISSAHTCAGTPFTYAVTIRSKPDGNDATKADVCSDVPFSFDPQNDIVNSVVSTFTWTATYDAGLSVNGAVPPANGTGVISGHLTNTGNTTLEARYVVTATAGTCVGDPYTITVPILPEPVVATNLNEIVCSRLPYNKLLDTNGVSVGAANYDITAVVDAGLTGIPTTGNGLLANALLNDAFVNVTAIPQKVTYTITPHGTNGCVGDPKIVELTVNPEPVVNPALDNTVCSREISGIILSTNGTSVAANSYRLVSVAVPGTITADPLNVLPATTGNINLIRNDKYINSTSAPVVVTYEIIGISPLGCEGQPEFIDLTISPEPIMTPGVANQCSDLLSGIIVGPAVGSTVTTSFELKNVVKAPALVAGSSNAGLGTYPANLAGGQSDFLSNDTFTNTTAGPLVVTYTIVPIAGTCRGQDQTVVFTVNPAPAVAVNLNRVVCSEDASGIVFNTAPSSAAAADYRITNIVLSPSALFTRVAGNATFPRSGVPTTDIQNDAFRNHTNVVQTVTYTVQARTAAGCFGPARDIVLTVEPMIRVVDPANEQLCSGQTTAITLNSPSVPSAGQVTFNYTAAPSAPGMITITALNNLPQGFVIADAPVNNTNVPQTITYTITPVAVGAKSGSGCTTIPAVEPQTVVVTIEPKPRLIPTRIAQTTCEGVALTGITLNSSTTPSASNGTVIFDLVSVVDPGTSLPPANVTGFSAVGTDFTPGQALTDVLSNTSSTTQVIRYTFRPQFSAGLVCVGDDVTIDVTITPSPVVTAVPAVPPAVCSNGQLVIDLTTDTDPLTTIVTWTTSVSSPDVIGASAGAGNQIFQTLINRGTVPHTVTYNITPRLNGCAGTMLPITVTVNPLPVINPPPRATVCGGNAFVLNLLPFVNTNPAQSSFEWTVFDVNGIGTPGQFDGSGTGINQPLSNPNDFSATLIYTITPIGPGGCRGLERNITVTVAPVIDARFLTTDEGFCAGTPIFLTFELDGQAPFNFSYRETTSSGSVIRNVVGSGNVRVERVTPAVSTRYEILSAVDALGCPMTFTTPPQVNITIFRTVTAGWTAVVPPLIGGSSVVTFTNTSVPIDPAEFRYEWTFGNDLSPNPQTATGVGPFNVNYDRQGDHFVTLRAVNVLAEAAGKSCESTFSQRITIPILPLVANFIAEPKRVCFPSTITVTSNTSTGDIMEWRVVDQNGRTIVQSNLSLPEFLITSPGSYSIFLTTRDSRTGATANTQQTDFEVFANPVASFDLRPNIVHVPDTKVTTFNFSTGATDYLWDFGDGGTSDLSEPEYTYKVEGQYDVTLVAMNDHGGGVVCRDTLVRQVTAKQGGVTKVPNAFTPNLGGPNGGVSGGGGSNGTFNDVFLPIVKGAEEFNLQIFDRWGNLIFESNSSTIGWDGYNKDGKIMPAGVYVYKLTLRLSDGQRTTQIGDITMIR